VRCPSDLQLKHVTLDKSLRPLAFDGFVNGPVDDSLSDVDLLYYGLFGYHCRSGSFLSLENENYAHYLRYQIHVHWTIARSRSNDHVPINSYKDYENTDSQLSDVSLHGMITRFHDKVLTYGETIQIHIHFLLEHD